MKRWSISFSYRLGLGFHALNNEGADGSNLMQPRRIDVGNVTYDGISGEIIRRHILENFVSNCEESKIPTYSFSQALHPDRAILGIRKAAKDNKVDKLTKSNSIDLLKAVKLAIQSCAVIDIGGFLAPFSAEGKQEDAEGEGKTNNENKIKAQPPEAELFKTLAKIGNKQEGAPITVKRDSVFDVAWLISENPQDYTVTQHSAYRPSGDQSLFSQSMRSNIYGGVVRADLHRIGTNDYWYLLNNDNRYVVGEPEIMQRQLALVKAIIDFICSPTGAKTAGWAPHVFLIEGAILLSSNRTAPFISPIKVSLKNNDENNPVCFNSEYITNIKSLADVNSTWVYEFKDAKELLDIYTKIKTKLDEDSNEEKNKTASNTENQ